uniref:E3 ubiquitin-protein ligase Topors n=1 Tax=Cairina moschata TaxID=8855 RepID=A0A8C3CX07_CAIMO
ALDSRTGARASPEDSSWSHLVVLPCPCQQVENIAMALDSRCPICLDRWDNASYVLPCLHQFYFRCIQRWAESKPECPLCKGTISSTVHSLRADDKFKEVTITVSAEALDAGHPDDPGPQHPAGSRPQAVGLLPGGLVGSFHPTTWAFIFRLYPQVLQPLLPWLHHELEQLLGVPGCGACKALKSGQGDVARAVGQALRS